MLTWQDNSCPPDTLLIRLAAGEAGLAGETRDRLESHLAQCPACRKSLEAIRQVNALLDQWEPAVPAPPRGQGRDLAETVVAQTLARPNAVRLGWVLRVAASVLICGAVGFGLGRWTHPAMPIPASPAPDDEAVAMALGLDSLAEQTDLLGTVDFSGAGEGAGGAGSAGEAR